ncbi:hypothetical protein VPH35_078071 [Triticum aestivum]
MASSEGNYHRRGPYFDGTNFASWKHKMKMHILGHNPAVWAIVCIGLQGEFFDGKEPNREATAQELKMLQYNAQACDILFNGLCPEEFNKISRLENAKEIWDTLIDMHEGTDSVKESKLDVLQSQLDKFKMKDGEGVAEMYSRLALITNEIVGLGSEEMTDKFIIKKILRALDGKYDTVCTLIQMMPNYKDLKPTEVIGRIVAHEMSLKDKEELHNKSSGAYKASCDAPTSSSEKQTFNEELSLMVKNFNKFYKSRSKERSSKSRSYNDKRSSSLTLEQENSLLKGIIEKGVYKSLAGSKQFEEIERKQGRHRKNQGVGFERKFNANGVEWEEDQYPKTKFVTQQEKYDPTSFKGTQAQDDLPPQDHKKKGKDKLQEEIDAFEEAPKALVKWVPKTTSSTTTTARIPIKMV